MLFECEQPFLWGEVLRDKKRTADYTYFISFLLETRENGQGLPEGEPPGPVSYSEYLGVTQESNFLEFMGTTYQTEPVLGEYKTAKQDKAVYWWASAIFHWRLWSKYS